jgi:hypothetical protein
MSIENKMLRITEMKAVMDKTYYYQVWTAITCHSIIQYSTYWVNNG